MASVASLREHLVEELNDLLNAEQQLIDALPKMAERASSRELRAAFKAHLVETRQHEKRAAQALKKLGEKAAGKTCEAMKGLLEEGQELMDGADAGALRDAMMITAAQRSSTTRSRPTAPCAPTPGCSAKRGWRRCSSKP